MAITNYHYTECGLDNIYLVNGFKYVDGPVSGRVVIKDIDGLHEAIGRMLVNRKESFTGKEIRFLRQEMLMSQEALAKLLQVSVQGVHRWEKSKSGVPKPAEMLIRLLYREHIHERGPSSFRAKLEKISDIEDDIDGLKMMLRKPPNSIWRYDEAA